ncbi:PepSY domain-containing protein [Brevibacillus reuszeri]|uniref:PepSY-associated TM helix domain-containing protein n=1 Tax=Brevibacillus reuszeri TaxID=54915 RepID=UPI001B136E9F|nr:PepSY domain-containing protein [Brevibacillus reuszeri]GIO08322.1 PepSY domain-containing protein [Brevibacillus reuszeri]
MGNYNRFWRWHFYAALFITPLLITLTLSGIGYLFYTDVENKAYADLFFGKSSKTETLTVDEGIKQARNQFDGFAVSKVIMLDEPYNTRLTMKNAAGEQKYVFLDQQNQTIGSQDARYTFSNVMRETHSSLFVGGTVVNYLVELAATWAIFLLVSGLYLTFKGRVWKQRQKLSPRQSNKKRHAIVGTIITIPMIIIIFTGLPWSAFMGDFIYTASQKYPSLGQPQVEALTSDMSEVPWATRKNEAPASTDAHAHHGGMNAATVLTNESNRLPIEQLMQKIEEAHISKPYSIVYPSSDDGVYTVSKSSNTGVTGLDVSPYEEMTAYFDQYSGRLIAQTGYEDYGILAKWFTWGIPLHEGHLFGWANKLLNTVVCLAFLLVIFWGIKTWLSRKAEKQEFAPPKVSSPISFGFLSIVVVLGVIMPLFGISLLVVALIEGILHITRGKRGRTA